jgi:hypothetical protein
MFLVRTTGNGPAKQESRRITGLRDAVLDHSRQGFVAKSSRALAIKAKPLLREPHPF